MAEANSKWAAPFMVVAFDAGAVPPVVQGQAVGCSVVEIVPGVSWDIVPSVNAQAPKLIQSQLDCQQLAGAGTTLASTLSAAISPAVYPGVPEALRVTAVDATNTPVILPAGTMVSVRGYRQSA